MTDNIIRPDKDYMAMAIALSMRGRGNSGSNPNVGCVIVKKGHIIGRGWTQAGGRPHAEAMALDMAGSDAQNADIYVTLEPCYHQSARGPNCANTIIKAKPKRLICALIDPDPRTNGKGITAIRAAGIEVVENIMAKNAHKAMAGFFTRIEKQRPFITLKLALSIDGHIAMQDGSSQWITGDRARAHTHIMRSIHDAILVGSDTVRHDKPRLDVRLEGLETRSPLRYQLGSSSAPNGWTSIASLQDIEAIEGNYLMVEGGSITAASFLRADLVDRILLYRAPIILGAGKTALADYGLHRLNDAHEKWQLNHRTMLGKDTLEIYDRV